VNVEDIEDVAGHVRTFLRSHTEQSRSSDRWRRVVVDDVTVRGSDTDSPDVVIMFHTTENPLASFGFRFRATPDDDERRWTPQQWATVVASNLLERVESGSGLPKGSETKVTWI
jgi:hypothetical protein